MSVRFRVIYDKSCDEWVGLCDSFPTVSVRDLDKSEALLGIKEMVDYIVKDTLKQRSQNNGQILLD
jgi:hypothetical protein